MTRMPNHYQIRVSGHFDHPLAEWFVPLTVNNEANGEATLTGLVRDQAEFNNLEPAQGGALLNMVVRDSLLELVTDQEPRIAARIGAAFQKTT